MYINSTEVSVFPLSKPRKNKNSRLFYEENVANLIRQVVDKASFIISSPSTLNRTTLTEDLIFNIYGYYFKINSNVSFDIEEGKYIVGKIKLDINGDLPVEIEGQDVGNEYQGLEVLIVNDLPKDSETEKYIVLFNRENSQWVSNKAAFVKFESQSFTIDIIDGKH